MIKQSEYQENEKIKIVQKLAQVEHDHDVKTHLVHSLKSQLSDKNDTLEALRLAKRDVEIRLQNQWISRQNLSQTEDQLQALKAELAMQESIMEEMQVNLSRQIDEINVQKEAEIQAVKDNFSSLFNEKAQELESLRQAHDQARAKIDSQSRIISDLEFREKELSDLLDKKQSCHHREFDKTYDTMVAEMQMLHLKTAKSEAELTNLRALFHDLQNIVKNPIMVTKHCEEKRESTFQNAAPDSTSHDSIEVTTKYQSSKRKRGKKKKR